MRNTFLLLLASLLGAACAGAPLVQVGQVATGPASAPVFAGAEWDDGMALVNTYRGRIKRYGVWRDAEVRDYLVREHLDAGDLTKRDVPDEAAHAVLKANRMLEFEVGSYGYRTMSSGFWRRDDASLVKAVGSCQNACGVVFQRWDATSGRLRADSYWEYEGQREWALPACADRRFADELPFVANFLPHGSWIEVLPPLSAPRLELPPGALGVVAGGLGVGDECAECSGEPAVAAGAAAATVPGGGRQLRVSRVGAEVRLLTADGRIAATFVYDARGELESWSLTGEQEFRRVARFRGAYWERTAGTDRQLVAR